MHTGTLAWTYDGRIDFYIDRVNKEYNFWGSSINENHPDVVRSNKTKINLPCVDIAGLINTYDVDDVVVVKMDIEGNEAFYFFIFFFIKKYINRVVIFILSRR